MLNGFADGIHEFTIIHLIEINLKICKTSHFDIGISCLFVASKVEEIYPPKLQTFAYVTDGACTEAEILDTEIIIMKTLKWKLTPVTPCNWLNIYLQVLSSSPSSSANGTRTSPRSRNVLLHRDIKINSDSLITRPLYSGIDFVRAIRILDLSSLDLQSLTYTYATLAAAAIYNIKGKRDSKFDIN